MQHRFTKGLEPLFVKRLAMLISICYLLNPLHQQISTFFHEISHVLESPEYILSHGSNLDREYEIHNHTDHVVGDSNHDHTLVDLIDSFLEASHDHDHNDSDSSVLTKIKINKHLTIDQYTLKKHATIRIIQCFWSPSRKLTLGHMKLYKEPPQHIHFPCV